MRSMARIRLRDPSVPPALMGWLLVVDQGLPRYWATVWVALHGAALHESTLSAHLSVIESMYRSVQIQLNEDCLDRLCSGQPIPDSGLSFSSATAGGSPSLN